MDIQKIQSRNQSWFELFFQHERHMNDAIASNPLLCHEDGTPIVLCGKPLSLSNKVIDNIAFFSELVWSAFEKAVSYVADAAAYGDVFAAHIRFARENRVRRRYPNKLYLCRFDFRLGGDDLPRFMEFN